MANQKNPKASVALESLNLDFSNACSGGKRILIAGVIDEKLLLADFVRHARICPVCTIVVDKAIPKMGFMEIAALAKGML